MMPTTLRVAVAPNRQSCIWLSSPSMTAVGASWAARTPFYPVMIELGYPGYLATIMGTAKIIAAVILAAPGCRD